MTTSQKIRDKFVKRLKDACDRSAQVPLPYKGRQVYIAQKLEISAESVNKWFSGTSMPKPERMSQLAKLLDADESWLSLGLIMPEGIGLKRAIQPENSNGATNLVYGMMRLAGITCGLPSPKDPRGSYVDFDIIVNGTSFPIKVLLGIETLENTFDFILPKEQNHVRLLGVINLGSDRYHFLDFDQENVELFREPLSPSFKLTVKRDESGVAYRSQKHTWSRIASFSKLS